MIHFEDLCAAQRYRGLCAMRASPEGTRPVGARWPKAIARGPAKREAPNYYRPSPPQGTTP
jgi:hypothetical protein